MKPSDLVLGNGWSAITAAAVVVGVAGLMVGFEVRSPIGGVSTKSNLVSQGVNAASSLAENYPGSQAAINASNEPILLIPVLTERELVDLREKSSVEGVLLVPYIEDISVLRKEYETQEDSLRSLPSVTFEIRSEKLDPQGLRAAERLAFLVKNYPYVTELTSISDGAVSPDLAKRRLDSLLLTLEGLGAPRSKIKASVLTTNTVVEKRIITKATLQWQTS